MSIQYIEDYASSPAASPVLTVQWATSHIVLTGHLDGTLCAFDATNGVLLAQIKAHADSLHCLTVNSRVALSSALDGTASLWSLQQFDTNSGGSERTQHATSQVGNAELVEAPCVCDVAESHSSTTATDLQPLATTILRGPDGGSLRLPSTALHPSGRWFAAAGEGAHLSIHSAEPGDVGQVIASSSSQRSAVLMYTTSLALSSSGNYVALGTDFGHVYLFSLSATSEPATSSALPHLQLIAQYTSHALPIRALAFDATGSGQDNHLFVGSDDRIITLYDVASLKQCHAPKGLLSPVSFLQGHKGTIDHLAPLPIPHRTVSQRAGRPNVQTLLASTSVQDGFVRMWDLDQRPKRAVCVIRAGGDTSTSVSGDSITTPPTIVADGRRLHDSIAQVNGGGGDRGDGQDEGEATASGHGQQGGTAAAEEITVIGAPRVSGGATSIAWRPLQRDDTKTAGPEAGSAFVIGGTDGIVRWYRAGGTGGNV